MKKVPFIIGMILLFILPNVAFAHTNLTSSNPEEGSIITEPVNEIVLTFNTTVEPLSTIKLMKNGSDVPLEVKAEGDTLKGSLANELENGTYTADWKIIGGDGHEIDGTVSFEVQQEVEEDPETTDAAEGDESQNEAASEKDQKEAVSEEEKSSQQTKSAETEQSNNNSTMTIVLVAIGVLAVAGIVFLMKKKG